MPRGTIEKSSATDRVESEIIKGPGGTPPSDPPTAGQSQTTAQASPEAAPSASGSVSASSSLASSAGTGSSDDPRSAPGGRTEVHTIVTHQVGSLPVSPEIAMQYLRGDIGSLHKMVANAAHHSSLPVSEAERLVARMVALLGVVKGS
jgi:hypothetical protein